MCTGAVVARGGSVGVAAHAMARAAALLCALAAVAGAGEARGGHERCPEPLTAQLMLAAVEENRSLLEYMLPPAGRPVNDIDRNWVPHTSDCELSRSCWCTHVQGSMDKIRNPGGIHRCMYESDTSKERDCANTDFAEPLLAGNCSCFVSRSPGQGCLFGDMGPAKLLATISLARRLGVTRVVEEGRYGGLSACIYALHGLDVTSIEFLPLDDATDALRRRAPGVQLLDGNARQLVPEVLQSVDPERERVAVVFDGTKRFDAYKTFEKIKDKVVFAVFDDTNVADGGNFRAHLQGRGACWSTDDESFGRIREMERSVLEHLVGPFKVIPKGNFGFMGGIHQLDKFHLSIVQGGAWSPRRCRPQGEEL